MPRHDPFLFAAWKDRETLAMNKRMMAGFAGLCLISGSGWIFDQVSPGVLQGSSRTAAHEGLLAILFGLASLWSAQSPPSRNGWSVELRLALWGIALLGLPVIVMTAAGGTVSGLTVRLTFMLAPAILVFLLAQAGSGFGDEESPMRLLVPALAGLGGAALLLPFTWPVTFAGMAWLMAIFAAAILSALASIRLHGILAEVSHLRAAAIACGGTAIAVGVFAGLGRAEPGRYDLGEHGAIAVGLEVLRCVLVDGPVTFLTIWLLREMKPVNFASRYFLVPWITIVEGYAIERPAADWTLFAGALLMAAAGTALLVAPTEPAPVRLL